MENEKSQGIFIERSKNKIWTQLELDKLSSYNVSWISMFNKVYDLSQWMEKHPGGDLILKHFLHKDATDQFTRFHPPEVAAKILPYLQIGVLEKPLKEVTPLMQEFRLLEEQLKIEGFFDTNYNFYYIETVKGLSTLIAGILLVIYGSPCYFNYILAASLIAFCWHQLSFVAHDTGHNAITHNLTFDNYYGIFLASCLSGLSIGWWKDSHNVHHVVTNDPEHDPDIQHMPFLAVSEKFIDGVKSSYHEKELKLDAVSGFFVRFQHILYYIIMMFGRFNLYVQSVKFLISNSRAKYRKSEMLALSFFGVWYIYLVSLIPDWKMKFIFVILTNAMTFVLHVQITLSHFAMSTETVENEDFVTHQIRTCMDVDCSEWLDWFHGGLQYQVVHHLFPRIPRHNLRKVRDRVRPFFEKHNLNYQCYDFALGNMIVIKHLSKIGDAVTKYLKLKQN